MSSISAEIIAVRHEMLAAAAKFHDMAEALQRIADSLPIAVPVTNGTLYVAPDGSVFRYGVKLDMPIYGMEHKLLMYLQRRQNVLCSYWDIHMALWGEERDKASIHELLHRIRRKIEIDPLHPKFLISKKSFGLILNTSIEKGD